MALSKDAEDYKAAELRLGLIEKIEKKDFEEMLSETWLCSSQILAEAEDAMWNWSDTKH